MTDSQNDRLWNDAYRLASVLAKSYDSKAPRPAGRASSRWDFVINFRVAPRIDQAGPSARNLELPGLNRPFELLRRNEPACPRLQRIRDNAGLGLDEIAPGLPEVRSFDDRHDTFDPVGRDPSRDVIGAQEAQRLLNSLLAVCPWLCGFAEDPAARPGSETVVALKEDGYAHGGAQLAV
jgi:hypothetical protein